MRLLSRLLGAPAPNTVDDPSLKTSAKIGQLDATLSTAGLTQDASHDPSSKLGTLVLGLALSAFTAIVAFFTHVWVVVGTNNGAIDVPAIQAAFDAAQGVGSVYLFGNFQITSAITPRSFLDVYAHPGVTINGAMVGHTDGGDDTNSIFHFAGLWGAPQTTLAADFTSGQQQVTLTNPAGFAVGSYFTVSDQGDNRVAAYQITSLAGAVATLDRPMVWGDTFAAGAKVAEMVPLLAFRFYGNGCLITGTGDRWFSAAGAWDCIVSDVRVQGAFLHYQASFDYGGVRNAFLHIRAKGDGVHGSALLAAESNEGMTFEDCRVGGSNLAGYRLVNCTHLVMHNCHATGCASYGVYLGTNGNPGEVMGVRASKFSDSTFNANALAGMYFDMGSSRNECVNVTANDTTTYHGFWVANQVAAPVLDNEFIGCTAERNHASGFVAVSTSIKLTGCKTRYNLQRAVTLGDCRQATLVNCTLRENVDTAPVIEVLSGTVTNLTVIGCEFLLEAPTSCFPIYFAGGAGVVTLHANSFKSVNGGGWSIASPPGSENSVWHFSGNRINGFPGAPSSGASWHPYTTGVVGHIALGDEIQVGALGSTSRAIVDAVGTNSPEGVVIASRGSTYRNLNGAPGSSLYVKTANDQSAAGWTVAA